MSNCRRLGDRHIPADFDAYMQAIEADEIGNGIFWGTEMKLVIEIVKNELTMICWFRPQVLRTRLSLFYC
jgi:hypothetical protein